MFTVFWLASLSFFYLFYIYINLKIMSFPSEEEAVDYVENHDVHTIIFLVALWISGLTTAVGVYKFFTNTLF